MLTASHRMIISVKCNMGMAFGRRPSVIITMNFIFIILILILEFISLKQKISPVPGTSPVLVEAGKGLIDPCPLWDDNGKAYTWFMHMQAAGPEYKSIIVVKQMNADGTKTIR